MKIHRTIGLCANFLSTILVASSALFADEEPTPYVVILGIAQDAGYPQAGCDKQCCASAWEDLKARKFASSIAIVSPNSGKRYLIDCTPDFRDQLRLLDQKSPLRPRAAGKLDGIFLTHAHIGHYAGLIHLGREVMGAKEVSVFAMPRMAAFLSSNGPWSQLVDLQQIKLERIAAAEPVRLDDNLSVVPFLVPHRDEFSETVGFHIRHSERSIVYLPDIDQWHRWDVAIETIIAGCDVALLDGTFFGQGELPGRDMSKIPHPLIQQSIERFRSLPSSQRRKIRFIHLNHSNPALKTESREYQQVVAAGMQIATQGSRIEL
ncbi:MAG: pyrroloquinoline quinone biosynthesis protein PqqB [Aureliella sp.]